MEILADCILSPDEEYFTTFRFRFFDFCEIVSSDCQSRPDFNAIYNSFEEKTVNVFEKITALSKILFSFYCVLQKKKLRKNINFKYNRIYSICFRSNISIEFKFFNRRAF